MGADWMARMKRGMTVELLIGGIDASQGAAHGRP